MIAFFKNNLFVNSLLLLPYALILRLSSFIDPVAYRTSEGDTYMAKWIYNLFDSSLSQSIFAVILVFIQALLINRISIKNRLGLQITLVSGLMYIILVSFIPEYTQLTPTLIVNTCLIWALSELFSIYKKSYTAISIFNTGLAIGLASLIMPSCIFFLVLSFLALIIMKSFGLVDTLQGLVGFLTAMYLTYSISILCGANLGEEISKYSLTLNLYKMMDFTKYPIVFGFVVLIIATCILGYNKNMVKRSVQSQKKIDILYWVLAIGFIVTVVSDPIEIHLIKIIAVPASMLLAMRLLRIKNTGIQEVIHLGLLGVLFYLHFGLA